MRKEEHGRVSRGMGEGRVQPCVLTSWMSDMAHGRAEDKRELMSQGTCDEERTKRRECQ